MEGKTLHLNLKSKWFNMVLENIKKQEYRDLKPYYDSRFIDAKVQNKLDATTTDEIAWKEYETVTFTNGYSSSARQIVVNLFNITIGYGLEDWGAEKGKEYYVLNLGDILSTKNIPQ